MRKTAVNDQSEYGIGGMDGMMGAAQSKQRNRPAMRTMRLSRWLDEYGLFLLLLIALIAGWELIVRLGSVPDFIIPAPSSVWEALIADSRLLLGKHLLATIQEVALGFTLSVIGGIALAVSMHASRTIHKAFYPFIVMSQTMPLIALSPIFIMWFGYTIWSKVAVVFLIAFFPIVVGAYDGLGRGDREYRELMLTMGATRRDIFLKVQVPLALPSFFSGLKLSVVYCVVGATIGEWLGGNAGLGYFSRRMSGQLSADSMFAAIFLLSVLGLVLFAVIAFLEKTLIGRRGTR